MHPEVLILARKAPYNIHDLQLYLKQHITIISIATMMMITRTAAAMMGAAQELVELGGSAVMWAIWKIMNNNYVCSLESESGLMLT